MDWPKDSRKGDYYINEDGKYEMYFQVNSERQNTLEDIAAMCCFFMFGSSLQTE